MIHNESVPDQTDLIKFIATTVESLRGQMETMREQMATKDDLAAIETRMETRMDNRFDAIREEMATKQELHDLEKRLTTRIDRLEVKTDAMRGDIEQVQVRLDSIDRGVSARAGLVETEVSRIRSVVYLLAKDRPEILRLLG